MNRKSYNYGLALLRIWMCFEVVLDHFWIHDTYTWPNPLAEYGSAAVPIFMIMSFFFTDIEDASKNVKTIRTRIGRIMIPQAFWAVVYCIILLILHDINWQSFFPDLILQCIFGHSVNQSMWFQFDLLVMTVLVLIYFKYQSKISNLCIPVLILLSLTAEYMGANSYIFGRLPEQISFPMGRICEMIPFVIIGIMLQKCRPILERLKKHAAFLCMYLLAVVVFILVFMPFSSVKYSFGYGGIHLIIIGTITFMIFYFWPVSSLPNWSLRVIRFASNYTLGIYCVHRLVERMLHMTPIYTWSDDHSFIYCILIFLIGLIISWLIDMIFGKRLKNVVR